MTLVEHLSELRLRIFISLAAIGVGSVVGSFFAPQVIDLLRAPVGQPLVFTSLGGAFFLQVKIAVIIGLVLSSPVVLYELWAFVSPGLTSHERRPSDRGSRWGFCSWFWAWWSGISSCRTPSRFSWLEIPNQSCP